MKYIFSFIILVIFSIESSSQIGGKNAYDFLNLPSSARITALGGHLKIGRAHV